MRLLMDVIGWSGSACIILAYALTLNKKKDYTVVGRYLNLTGGVLVAVNCYYYEAIPSFVTNMMWSVIATLTIYRNKKEKKQLKQKIIKSYETINNRRRRNYRL